MYVLKTQFDSLAGKKLSAIRVHFIVCFMHILRNGSMFQPKDDGIRRNATSCMR